MCFLLLVDIWQGMRIRYHMGPVLTHNSLCINCIFHSHALWTVGRQNKMQVSYLVACPPIPYPGFVSPRGCRVMQCLCKRERDIHAILCVLSAGLGEEISFKAANSWRSCGRERLFAIPSLGCNKLSVYLGWICLIADVSASPRQSSVTKQPLHWAARPCSKDTCFSLLQGKMHQKKSNKKAGIREPKDIKSHLFDTVVL